MVARNKLGFQTSNSGFDINTQLRCKGDNCVVMQYGDDVVPRILEVNPNMFFTFRWYSKNTIQENPSIIADQARGWIDGLKAANPTLTDEQFCIQLVNEPNIAAEYDDPGTYDSEENYQRIGQWEYEAISALKSVRPNYKTCCFNLAPGHSEDQNDNGYIAYSMPIFQQVANISDYIGIHRYWQNAGRGAVGLDDSLSEWYFQRFKKVHDWFPNKTLIINEANGDDIHLLDTTQRVIAAQELLTAINIVNDYDYIKACNFFIWYSPGHPTMYCDEVMNLFEGIDLPKYGDDIVVSPVIWRVIKNERRSGANNNGMHNIFFKPDNLPIRVSWPDGYAVVVKDFAMTPGSYTAEVYNQDSEIAHGMRTDIWEENPEPGNSYGHYSYDVEFSKEVLVNVDYPLAVWIGSPNFTAGRVLPVDTIVIHSMEGTLTGCDSWFQTGPAASHYGIGINGSIHQYVRESNSAWHVSASGYNGRSIGIELEGHAGDYFDQNALQWKSLIALTKSIISRHPITIFVAHSWVQSDRSDPGINFNWGKYSEEIHMALTGPQFILDWTEQQRVDKCVELINTNAHLEKVLKDIRTIINATV